MFFTDVDIKKIALLAGLAYIVPQAFVVLRKAGDLCEERRKVHADYPGFEDFYTALIAACVIGTVRAILCPLFAAVAQHPAIIKDKYQGTMRDRRASRWGACVFKLLYFLGTVSFEFFMLHDKDWTPPQLLGSGKTYNCWPDGEDGTAWRPPNMIKLYYMITLGYHTQCFFYHTFIVERKNDYLEMLLHHLLSMFLIGFSYLANFTRIGTLVLVLHNVPDIFGYATKAAADMPYPKFVFSCYLCLLVSWGYLRLYVFPFHVLYSAIYESLQAQDHIPFHLFFNVMLSALQVLHVYWFYLFLVMGARFIFKGEAEDIQQKIESVSENEAETRTLASSSARLGMRHRGSRTRLVPAI